VSQITPLIQRLDTWLQQNCPDYYVRLGSGATDEELAQLKETVSSPLPEEFVELYRWKNGANDLIPGELFMPLWHVIETRDWLLEYIKGKPFGMTQPWHPEFIPFFENGGGDYYCLDPVGVWNGLPGQIVRFVHDDQSHIETPSLERWLEIIVQCHESGAWVREQNREFCDFKQSDGWSATYLRVFRAVNPGYPKGEEWPE
jgi:cell wall assembly regulator SMI1